MCSAASTPRSSAPVPAREVRWTPPAAAVTGLVLNIPVYGLLHLGAFENICFLNKMAITFGVIVAVMGAITLLFPLKQPVVLPVKRDFNTTPAPLVAWLGAVIIVVVVVLYVILW